MSKRISGLVEEARRRSADITAKLPEANKVQRANHERIVEVCARLVGASPSLEPTSIAVAEQGRSLYNEFSRSQTLLNSYGELLRLWRGVHSAVVTASVPRIRKGHDGEPSPGPRFESLDAGERARIQVLEAVLRETRLENDRLKKLILDTTPAPGHAGNLPVEPSSNAIDLRSLKEWLDSVRDGTAGLEMYDDGIRISRSGRAGFQAMSKEALGAIEAIVSSF